MKQIILYCCLALLPALCLSGCMKEEEQQTTIEPGNLVTMSLSLGSRSAIDALASANESVITSAYVYIFNADGLLENKNNTKVQIVDGKPTVGNTERLNGSWTVYEGRKDIYVILNSTGVVDESGSSVTLAGYNPTHKMELLKLLTNKANFDTEFHFDQTGGMLMTGRAEAAIVSAANKEITVQMHRRYARIDLSVKKHADLASKTVIVQSVKLKNWTKQAILWETTPQKAITDADGTAQEQLSLNTSIPTGVVYTTLGKKLYMMPRPKSVSGNGTDDTKIPVLEIAATVDSIPQTYYVYLTGLTADKKCDLTKPLDIEGNTIYKVEATLTRHFLGVTVGVTIAHWNDREQDYPAGGGVFLQQPQSKRVGINGSVADATAVFTAQFSSKAPLAMRWYRKYQPDALTYTVEEITNGVNGCTITPTTAGGISMLTIVADGLDDSGEIYCIATTTTASILEKLESDHATLMVVGDWVQPVGTYPAMQEWKIPINAMPGATCLLQDVREDGSVTTPSNYKVYRVKLMADGNWWMIQDLAYGTASTKAEFDTKANYSNREVTNFIGSGLYGVCRKTGFSTGGYFYNTYAAIQLAQGSTDDHTNKVALHTEYIRGVCPEGWHLPGNMKGDANQEWVNMQTTLNADMTTPTALMRFSYNNSFDFNAYNLVDVVDGSGMPANAVGFMGGYESGLISHALTFTSLGFITTDWGNGAVTNIGISVPDSYALSIRCIRNFK